MPYVHCSRVPGRTLADYHTVNTALPGRPEGRLVSVAGEADGALHVIDIWDCRAHADRFTTETLFPVMRQLGLSPGSDATYVDFTTEDVIVEAGPR